MGVATIAVLGPLGVNGDTTALAPRDRIVLAALALRPGEVSSVERLADALWGAAPPPSWPKVVPGCVHRLRRVLGPAAIETTPYGYRLTVGDDDIDARRFERLWQRGTELLALGEPERALPTFDEALGLWRGSAFPDLDGWQPGRVAADRLAELRLDCQERRMDAALRTGRHADVLVQAQSAVAEAPLRERRWGQLALVQYRCGRQAEALQTLRRARNRLRAELGLDPGPDLVALEASILRQEPGLTADPGVPDVGGCPYLGLLGYGIDDAEFFFGREQEAADCLNRLMDTGVLAVVGPSGSGKSSLVRAGVGSALARDGRRPVVMLPGTSPTETIGRIEQVGITLIVDQFEEVFTNCPDPDERRRFCDDLVARAQWCRVVVALRADHLPDLAGHPPLARLVERGLYLLGPMGPDALRAAITRPAERAGLLLEPGLVDLLVREVEGAPGALPLLSHALRRTWERREGRTLTVAGYQAAGGIRGCVARSAEDLYESLTDPQRDLLRQILLRLISTTGDGDPIRIRVPRRQLLTDPDRTGLAERLAGARLVTIDRDTVQVAHESLARAWPRLAGWLEEDVEGQRILRHLTATADAWDGLGRPDSELYRGIRLDRAVDWRRRCNPELAPVERSFLDAGVAARDTARHDDERRIRQQVRVRRRNRLLVLAAVVLLVSAAVAGVLAVRQQGQREEADRAALAAQAHRVDEVARAAPEVDRALLLAVEANRLDDSPDTRAAVAGLLSDHQTLIRSVVTDGAVPALAVSPDGSTLLVGQGEAGITILRTDTLDRTAARPDVNGWSMDYRADGDQVLLTGKGATGLGEYSTQMSASIAGPDLAAPRHLPASGIQGRWVYANDIAYSADGRRFAVYAEGGDGDGPVDPAELVWDAAAPDGPPLRVGSVEAMAVSLSPDGSLLYVLTQDPGLEVIDVATTAVVASRKLPAGLVPLPEPDQNASEVGEELADTLEISPDGGTLAVAEGNDVMLLDAATLTQQARLHGPTGRVRTVRFSHDGRLLAVGADDHTLAVWDVGLASVVQQLSGHSGAVLATAFSPDDTTLYSGGADRRLLVWDLNGRRSLGGRIAEGDRHAGLAAAATASPDGSAVAFADWSASGPELRLLDLATGRSTAAAVDRIDHPLLAWRAPGDEAVLVADHREIGVVERGSGQFSERVVVDDDVTALAVGPDDAYAVVGNARGDVARLDAGTLRAAGPPVPLGSSVTALATLPDGRAAAVLGDGTYAVVDLANGSVRERGDLGFPAQVAAASPDGSVLAVGGPLGAIGLIDPATGRWIAAPGSVDRENVVGMSFSADGALLVSTSADGTVRLWDGRTREAVAALRLAGQLSGAATVVAGGTDVEVATRSGSVHRLDARFSTWIGVACSVAGRNLTADEWRAVFADRPYHTTCPAG